MPGVESVGTGIPPPLCIIKKMKNKNKNPVRVSTVLSLFPVVKLIAT